MEHVEYVYTGGMDEAELERRLREQGHGVLAVARDGDAYAVPLNYAHDGDRLLLRVSESPGSTKAAYVETTDTATFVLYDVDDEQSAWSILVRGPIRRLPDPEGQFTDDFFNEEFPPFHLFDEEVADVDMAVYELVPDEITGRKTIG